jgi:hypothetical protein
MLELMLETAETGHVLDVTGLQELPDHVQDEERLHPGERKALPRFRKRQKRKTARVPE